MLQIASTLINFRVAKTRLTLKESKTTPRAQRWLYRNRANSPNRANKAILINK